MSPPSGQTVFVAMPVYRGTGFVAETLRSMLAQTHAEVRIMISVDGNDTDSADACAPFLADDRVRMQVQERQLGWVDNMNWLIDACDGDYFCYWQQDDRCEPTYFEKLLSAFERHPGAACAYSDLRWFGRSDHEVAMPSLAGFTQQRILAQIEAFHWVPLRGLVPVDVLRRVGPIRGLHDSITFSDYLWVLRLAIVGDLIRVPEVLYHKRDHAASASKTQTSTYHVSLREAWITLGLTMFSEVSSHFPAADLPKLALVIADRLVMPGPGRWFHYDAASVSPTEQAGVMQEFFTALETRSGVRPPISASGEDGTSNVRSLVEELVPLAATSARIAQGALAIGDRRSLLASARSQGQLSIDCSSEGPGASVLLSGWAESEAWGTWSDGAEASVWLPLPADGRAWRVELIGQPFLPDESSARSRRLIVSHDEEVLLDHRLAPDEGIPSFALAIEPGDEPGTVLRFDLPDPESPASLGLGGDQRLLSIGLERIEITREGAAPVAG